MRVYVAAPLFSAHARSRAARIARAVAAVSPDSVSVFLPFRDSEQSKIEGPNKSRLIFEADLAHLGQSQCVVAFIDQWPSDAGVAMEIGYAFAAGIPVIGASSSFVSLDGGHPLEPLLHAHVWIPDHQSSVRGYEAGLREHEHLVDQDVSKEVARLIRGASPPGPGTRGYRGDRPSTRGKWLVDVCDGGFEWARRAAITATNALQATGVPVESLACGARRLNPEAEVSVLRECEGLAVWLDAIELAPRTAAAVGIACRLGTPIALVRSAAKPLVGPGGQTMFANLMIEEAASIRVSSLDALVSQLSRWRTE